MGWMRRRGLATRGGHTPTNHFPFPFSFTWSQTPAEQTIFRDQLLCITIVSCLSTGHIIRAPRQLRPHTKLCCVGVIVNLYLTDTNRYPIIVNCRCSLQSLTALVGMELAKGSGEGDFSLAFHGSTGDSWPKNETQMMLVKTCRSGSQDKTRLTHVVKWALKEISYKYSL